MGRPSIGRSGRGIVLQLICLMGMPVVLGRYLAELSQSPDVTQTSGFLLELLGLYLLISLVMLFVGVFVKSFKELILQRKQEVVGPGEILSSLDFHLRILTERGWTVLLSGVFFSILAVNLGWASLGLMATLVMLVFYGLLGTLSLLTAIQVGDLEGVLGSNQAKLERRLVPPVVLTGDDVEEQFHLDGVPVPMGLTLIIEDMNPPCLHSSTRHALGSRFLGRASGNCVLTGRLRTTPRGLHRLGPARISYRDAFGFIRLPLASWATGELKVLPRFTSLEIERMPTTVIERPDVITRLHRFATEDPFRFKDYGPGDDSRRIHWRLSVRRGELQVRVPESRETHSRHILVILDSWVHHRDLHGSEVGLDLVLDRLVAAWISLAAKLVLHGERVSLIAAVDDGTGCLCVESVDGREDRRRWQDLGARAKWQSSIDLPKLLSASTAQTEEIVILTSRLSPAPSRKDGPRAVWVYHPPHSALPPMTNWRRVFRKGEGGRLIQIANDLFRTKHPPGSMDNTLISRFRSWVKEWEQRHAQRRLYTRAFRSHERVLESFRSRGDEVYRLISRGDGFRIAEMDGLDEMEDVV